MDPEEGDPLLPANQPPLQVDNGAAAVRMNLIRDVQNVRRARIAFWTSALFELPQVIAIAIVLAIHPGESCSSPLALWCILYGGRLLMQLVLRFMAVWESSRANGQDRWLRFYLTMREPLNLLAFTFFVVGNIWILDRNTTCPDEAPHHYRLALSLLIIEYAVWLLPCMVLLILIPSLCLCFPQVLRFLAWLDGIAWTEEDSPAPRATQEQLDEMGWEVYETGRINTVDGEEARCPICLTNYEVGDEIKQLQCHPSHVFHRQCLDAWMKTRLTCPLCRVAIVLPQGDAIV